MKHLLKTAATLALFALTPVSVQAHGAQVGSCDAVQSVFGENGGNAFVAEAPKSITLRHGSFVDNLILNGRNHGGNGGQATGQLTLSPGEYIDRMVIRHGKFVDRLEFSTNKGRGVSGGGGGGRATVLDNIRLLTLGGRSGKFLDQIQVTYCRNYLH